MNNKIGEKYKSWDTLGGKWGKGAAGVAGLGIGMIGGSLDNDYASSALSGAGLGLSIGSLFTPIGGLIGAGIGGLLGLGYAFLANNAKMATGGLIPTGFANDTFRARLTSGEAVIPLHDGHAIEKLKNSLGVAELQNKTDETMRKISGIHDDNVASRAKEMAMTVNNNQTQSILNIDYRKLATEISKVKQELNIKLEYRDDSTGNRIYKILSPEMA